MLKVTPSPTSCIEENPQRYSVEFGGVYISLTAISKEQGIDLGYLSRIFASRSVGSVTTLKKIANALGMRVQDFLDTMETRKPLEPTQVREPRTSRSPPRRTRTAVGNRMHSGRKTAEASEAAHDKGSVGRRLLSVRKTEAYVPLIEDGIPIPERATAVYTKKIADGELIRIGEQIKPGQSVVLPAGSIGKFRKIVEARGLRTICRRAQSDSEGRVWVLSPDDES